MVRLLTACIAAHQEYGETGIWTIVHIGSSLQIKRTVDGFYEAHDAGIGMFARSDRLEAMLADFAQRYPYAFLDGQWEVAS